MLNPKLRPIGARTQMENGYPYLVLEDPFALSARTLAVPQPWVPILHALDGQTSVDELYTRMQVHGIGKSQIDDLLAALDDTYLLDNARSDAAITAMKQQYRNAPYRQMSCAGGVYPADVNELRAYLDAQLASASAAPSDTQVRGILSPHIDYQRGDSVYAEGWAAIANQVADVELVIVFGTDHVYGQNAFTLTRQNYATPFGILPTDTDIVDALADAIGPSAFEGELFHRKEHSIELPLVWLHHLRQDNPPAIVPIMVSRLGSTLGLEHRRDLRAVMRVLREQTQGRKILVIASGDLAHVGPAFETAALHTEEKAALRTTDDALMQTISAGDALTFYDTLDRIDNCNNVCGMSPIYLMLDLLDNPSGQIHAYDQCPADAENTSVVSICSATFA